MADLLFKRDAAPQMPELSFSQPSVAQLLLTAFPVHLRHVRNDGGGGWAAWGLGRGGAGTSASVDLSRHATPRPVMNGCLCAQVEQLSEEHAAKCSFSAWSWRWRHLALRSPAPW